MVKLIAWNIAQRAAPWQFLLDTDADIALLQEATPPPEHLAQRVGIDLAHWKTAGAKKSRLWRTAIAKLSDRVRVEWLEPKAVADAGPRELAVSRLGTLAVATVIPTVGEPFVVASMYATWENPYYPNSAWNIYADASAHRVISDLAVLIDRQSGHRILAAGDLNVLYGYGENGSPYWTARYATVFDRMRALGLPFVGPQVPGGRCADPWPDELPRSSKNVPTYYTTSQTPKSATRQLDFVFASESLVEHVHVTALNAPEQWVPSDHCRIEITIV
jgi:endonuclease/exonuclease/phosphatase family metal-dependent hydrolase